MKLYTSSEAQHNKRMKRSLEDLKIIGNLSLAVNYGDLEMLPRIYMLHMCYSLNYYLATFLSRIFHEIDID